MADTGIIHLTGDEKQVLIAALKGLLPCRRQISSANSAAFRPTSSFNPGPIGIVADADFSVVGESGSSGNRAPTQFRKCAPMYQDALVIGHRDACGCAPCGLRMITDAS